MNRSITRARLVVVLLPLLLTASCMDMDPCGFAYRNIAGDFSIGQWEGEGTYCLMDSKDDWQDQWNNDLIGEIGWDDRYIFVRYEATRGWGVYDTELGTKNGPFSAPPLDGYPELRRIEMISAAQAWNRLPPDPFCPCIFAFIAAVIVGRRLVHDWRQRRRRRAAEGSSA